MGGAGAAPLVVWEGSHLMLREAFQQALGGTDGARQADEDVTYIYQATRRAVFESCRRVALPLAPGEAMLLDRHLLHGIGPWTDDTATAPRATAYFRPQLGSVSRWLGA